MNARLATTLAVVALMATPALAAGGRDVGTMPLTPPTKGLSLASQQCLARLHQVDRQLIRDGYGTVGPLGYAPYGNAYVPPAAPASTTATTGMLGTRPMGTPRSDMQTLLRAGYIMALEGHPGGCQAVADAASRIGKDYKTALARGEMSDQQLRDWRSGYLASAVSVTSLKRPMTVDQITDADLRNLQDRELGNVENVVLGKDGSVKYVIVGTGGFLGIGEKQIAVPWGDLKVTLSPYRDTLVLDVGKQAFDNGPTLQQERRADLSGKRHQEIDAYWAKHLEDGESG